MSDPIELAERAEIEAQLDDFSQACQEIGANGGVVFDVPIKESRAKADKLFDEIRDHFEAAELSLKRAQEQLSAVVTGPPLAALFANRFNADWAEEHEQELLSKMVREREAMTDRTPGCGLNRCGCYAVAGRMCAIAACDCKCHPRPFTPPLSVTGTPQPLGTTPTSGLTAETSSDGQCESGVEKSAPRITRKIYDPIAYLGELRADLGRLGECDLWLDLDFCISA